MRGARIPGADVECAGSLASRPRSAASRAQTATGASRGSSLPPDVDPVSRNRLASRSTPGVEGAAAIRLHVSGANVRWASPLGRAADRAGDSDHRARARPAVRVVAARNGGRRRRARAGHDRHRSASPAAHRRRRERGGRHPDRPRDLRRRTSWARDTYARALKLLGRANLVDVVDLMATYSATAARLTAFNQHMPPGWKQFLPLPFTLPDDIHADSRSRLPLIQRTTTQNPQANLYARQLAPEGTGPEPHRTARGRPRVSRSEPGQPADGARRPRHRPRASLAVRLDGQRGDGGRRTDSNPRIIDVVRRRHAAERRRRQGGGAHPVRPRAVRGAQRQRRRPTRAR